MFQRILLAADGSEHSVRAAEKAVDLLKGNKEGVIEVAFVVDPSSSKADVLHSKDSNERAVKRLEKLKPIVNMLDSKGIQFETKSLRGEPGPAIVKYANENNFDCVVIGSRGLNRLQSMVLGSVSHKVVKRVECPVMIVK